MVLIVLLNPLKHSGHFMYHTVVTFCTAQWSLYVPPGLTQKILPSAHSAFLCCMLYADELLWRFKTSGM